MSRTLSMSFSVAEDDVQHSLTLLLDRFCDLGAPASIVRVGAQTMVQQAGMTAAMLSAERLSVCGNYCISSQVERFTSLVFERSGRDQFRFRHGISNSRGKKNVDGTRRSMCEFFVNCCHLIPRLTLGACYLEVGRPPPPLCFMHLFHSMDDFYAGLLNFEKQQFIGGSCDDFVMDYRREISRVERLARTLAGFDQCTLEAFTAEDLREVARDSGEFDVWILDAKMVICALDAETPLARLYQICVKFLD